MHILVLLASAAALLVETDKLTSDVAEYDAFGYSIAMSGDRVVVGAYEDAHAGIKSGAAHIFRRDGMNYTRTQKLTASDAERYDRFSRAVAMSSNLVVAGAYGDDDGGAFAGAAYVFRTTDGGVSYVQTQKLTASGAKAFDYFGVDVAVSGDTLVVGAYGVDDAGSYAGACYIFHTTDGGINFVQTQQLIASDAAPNDWFGRAVAVSPNLVVVGATGNDDVGAYSGAVYIFRTTDGMSYAQTQKLTASDAAEFHWFGRAVAVASNLVVVGAYGDSEAAPAAGAAYVFRTADGFNFVQTQKLIASDATANDNFGRAVDMSSSRVLVGANRNDASAPGQAYAFKSTNGGLNFTQTQKLVGSDASPSDRFGFAVAISCDAVAIGAYWDEDARSTSGEAYAYRTSDDGLNVTRWNGTEPGFGCDVAVAGDLVVVGSFEDAVFVMGLNSTHKLEASDPRGSFGHAVGLWENVVVVGAPRGNAAYVFATADGDFVQTHKLTADDASPDDSFGYDVAISADLVVVGAPFSASAYVFDTTDFVQTQKLTSNDDDRFGFAVAASDDLVVVGAPFSDSRSGSVCVFAKTRSGLALERKLMARDAAPDDYFGSSVAISGDLIVAGAYGNEDAGAESGSAYVFSGLTQLQKLTASDAKSNDRFGRDVSIAGHVVAVGAPQSGSAYIFCTTTGGSFEQVHSPADDDADNFGVTVATDGNLLVVGAATNGTTPGRAYAFSFDRCYAPPVVTTSSSKSDEPAEWFLLLELGAFLFMVALLSLMVVAFLRFDPWLRPRPFKSEFEMSAGPPIAPVADYDNYDEECYNNDEECHDLDVTHNTTQ